MHELSMGANVFAYIRNGKIYDREIDWNKELQLQEDDILQAIETKIADESLPLYKDEEFKKFFQEVFYEENGIEKLLNANKEQLKYKVQIELILLGYGSYEFIDSLGNGKVFKNSTLEQRQALLKSLDKRINIIQLALIQYCKEANEPNKTDISKLLKIYSNYLTEFAPQRLASYTETPVNLELLTNMHNLKKLSMGNLDMLDISDKLIEFNSLYRLADILEILYLYRQIPYADNQEEKEKYLSQIDDITIKGVNAHGTRGAILNLVNLHCNKTLGKVADNIPYRINVFKAKKEDVSVEVDILVKFLDGLNKVFLQDNGQNVVIDCKDKMLLINKIFQIVDLHILSEEDEKRINKSLDNLLKRQSLEIPDMSKYELYITQKNSIPENIAKEFFKDIMLIILKDGIMPVEYNEYLIAQLLDENSIFFTILDDMQKMMIVENFARIKSKQLTNSKNYVTYSNKLPSGMDNDRITVGLHLPGFIKLMPQISKDEFMNIILNIININHELRHSEQQKSIKSLENNHLTYMMIKESVIKEIDSGFYDRNYDYMYEELDAEYFALKNALVFLETLDLSNFKSNENYKNIIAYLKKRISNLEERFFTAKNKKGENGKTIQIEEFLDEKIKEDPSILKKYPILKVEYNDDGSRKSVKQIFEEFMVICREKKNRLGNYDLYKYVLFSRIGIDLEQAMEISDINIPKDLSYSTREVLTKLKYRIVDKCIERLADEKDDVIPGRIDENDNLRDKLIRDFANVDEQITSEIKNKYDYIIGDDEERE